MTLILPTLAVAFAAFCIWLTVRIVNRRERWAKWTLAAVVGVPALYVASFGPACWITSHLSKPNDEDWQSNKTPVLSFVYRPFLRIMTRERQIRVIRIAENESHSESHYRYGQHVGWIADTGALAWYATCLARKHTNWEHDFHIRYVRGKPPVIENEEWWWHGP